MINENALLEFVSPYYADKDIMHNMWHIELVRKMVNKILSISNSDAAFESFFTEAGINQTLQQLTMEISVDVTVLVLGRTESFTVTSHVVVAETIIVGQVPDTLLQAGG